MLMIPHVEMQYYSLLASISALLVKPCHGFAKLLAFLSARKEAVAASAFDMA